MKIILQNEVSTKYQLKEVLNMMNVQNLVAEITELIYAATHEDEE